MFFEQLTETRRQGVTAVETTADRTIYYFHDGDGFRTEEEPFKPFILLSSPEQLSQFEGAFSPPERYLTLVLIRSSSNRKRFR